MIEFDELPHEIQVMIFLIDCYIQCLLYNKKINEMKSKYTQRHSHVWGRQRSIERIAELENLMNLKDYESFLESGKD